MPYRANYPATVTEILVDGRKYKPEVLRAVRAFRRSKAWQGTPTERLAKIRSLNRRLAAAYGICPPVIRISIHGGDCYRPADNSITLGPALSVVTYLHEFGHALGKDERQTCEWSVNLFRRVFPRSYARLQHVGHTLVR